MKMSMTSRKTGLPIADIPFPSVVICSQGTESESTDVSVYKAVLDYLNQTNGIGLQVSPLQMKRNNDKSSAEVVILPARLIFVYIQLLWGKAGSFLKPVVHRISSVEGNLFMFGLVCYFCPISQENQHFDCPI